MMNQEDIFRKIGLILDELQDQYAYLARNQQELNELELELFMANANFLSDHVQIVRKLNTAKIVKEIPEHSSSIPSPENSVPLNQVNWESPSTVKQEWTAPAETVTAEDHNNSYLETVDLERVEKTLHEEQETVHIPVEMETSTFEFILKDIGATDKFDFEEKSVVEIFDRVLSPEEEEIIAQKEKVRKQEEQQAQIQVADDEDEVGPEPFLVDREELVLKQEDVVPPARTQLQPDPIAEKIVPIVAPSLFNQDQDQVVVKESVAEAPAKPLSLNERLASQMGKTTHTTNTDPNKNTLTDLKHGINLNDKMLYIKDLFNGYNLAYAEVIDLLNKMSDFKSADAFLQHNYAEKNNWAAKSATVTKFYELLNQRFPAK